MKAAPTSALSRLILSGCIMAASQVVAAPLVYDEAVSGDLSDLHAAPTFLAFEPGLNIITGWMGRPAFGDPVDPDLFYFTIAPGFQLVAIPEISRTPEENSFLGLQTGIGIHPTDPQQHLSNFLVRSLDDDYLVALDSGPEFGGIGFNGPLGAGTYTMWYQELANRVDYTIGFDIQPVPEPGVAFLALAGGIALIVRRRHR